MAMLFFHALLVTLGYGFDDFSQHWECVAQRPCSLQLGNSHVSPEDLLVFTERIENVNLVSSCPTCHKADDGLCPWLTMDTGAVDVVLCADGNYNSRWACELNGHGGRILCPPNTTMCSNKACGGGLDHCCDPAVPDRELICIHSGGPRACPYISIQEDIADIVLNATHGPRSPGVYGICRCSPAQFASQTEADLIGKLHIRGPAPDKMHQCVSGQSKCRFSSPGGFGLVSLETSVVQVTTAPTCSAVADTPEIFVENFRFRWNKDWSNPYIHGQDIATVGQWISERSPGVYNLCWCENNTDNACESLSDFNVSAGMLSLRGPNKQTMRTATLGEEFQLTVSGVWMSAKSVMRLQRGCGHGFDAFYEAQAGLTLGSDLSYNFGTLTEARIPAGKYKLCWCQPQYQNTPMSTCTEAQGVGEKSVDEGLYMGLRVQGPQSHARRRRSSSPWSQMSA